MTTCRPAAVSLALAVALWAGPAAAQVGSVSGVVRDSTSGSPLNAVRVDVIGAERTRRMTTGSDGRFAFAAVPLGVYRVAFSRVGYGGRRLDGVRVPATGITLDIALMSLGIPLDPVVVSVSRAEETALTAPAAVSVITREDLEESVAVTPIEHARDVPGVDVARKGLLQHTFAFRGSSTANSGDVLMLHDYRYAAVPSIGFNVPYLVPTTDDDLDRIEVMRGPAAALYGPGAPRGIVHLLTRSPLDARGGSLTVTGGTRNVFAGALRYAAAPAAGLGVAVSGEYFRGDDWEFVDSVEAANRASAVADGADPTSLLVGRRDFGVERAGGEVRVDWRPDAATEVVATAGLAQAVRAIDLAPAVGSVQGMDWRYTFGQIRLRRHRLFANVVYNWSDAGDTYLLRTGAPLVDDSRVLVAQLQHGAARGPLDVVYGADVRWTNPRTGGTIHGINEADDLVTEIGGYLHATAQVKRGVDLIGAMRLDHHNRLEDLVISPRVGVVLQPAPAHAFRVTYNRAFTSPDANDLFLDIVAGRIPLPGGLGYTLRAVGVPKGGFTFRRDCDGGLCMRSPFIPNGAAAYLPLDATLLWPTLVALAQAQGLDLSAIPQPTADQVGTRLGLLDLAGSFVPIDPVDVRDIAGEGRTITNALEVGYKGLIGGAVFLTADLWLARLNDLPGALFAATPNAFFDRASLEQYLAGFLPADVAASLADTVSQLPVGTVSPQETAHPFDVLILNRRGGAYTLLGADVGVRAEIGRHWTISANYSQVSHDTIPAVAEVGTVFLNTPRRKAFASIAFRDEGAGVSVALRGRAVAGFPVVSGVYAGRVDAYAQVDAVVTYRFPWRWARLTIQVQNAFDDRHQEFVAAPRVGRLVLSRLTVRF